VCDLELPFQLSNLPTFRRRISCPPRLHPIAPQHGTLGGNLCLDTRCNYYNQSYEWRKSIDFCMKKDGHICWVAPSSPRCWAVSSSDVAPVMVAIGAEYRLVGPQGSAWCRRAVLQQRWNQLSHEAAGRDPGGRAPAEAERVGRRLPQTPSPRVVRLPRARRGGVGSLDGKNVADARIVLGGVASYPQEIAEAGAALKGAPLSDETIATASDAAYRPSKPMTIPISICHGASR